MVVVEVVLVVVEVPLTVGAIVVVDATVVDDEIPLSGS